MKTLTRFILLCIPFIGISQNMVTNSTFDGLGLEWVTTNAGSGSELIDPADSHTVDNSTSYALFSEGIWAYISQKFFAVNLDATDYVFSFYVKGTSGTKVRPSVKENNNSVIHGADYTINVTDEWEEVTGTFTISGTEKVFIRPYLISNNTSVLIDDVSFEKAATASTKDNKLTSFSMYPNPTSDMLNVQSQDQNSIDRISVYDILGKQIKSIAVGNRAAQINVADLSKGVYVLRVETDLGNQVLRFLKE